MKIEERETGTLAELNVKPGDVIEWLDDDNEWMGPCTVMKAELITEGAFTGEVRASLSSYGAGIFDEEQFRIISRASQSDPETPKRWKDLTPEEKGALLLAHHEGEVIEVRAQDSDNWYKRDSPNWADEGIFRVKPARETVTLYGDTFYDFSDFEGRPDFKITFDLVDGDPDTDSIRMEKL